MHLNSLWKLSAVVMMVILNSCNTNQWFSRSPVARVTFVEGRVEMQENPDGAWTTVTKGTRIREGSSIRTGQGYVDIRSPYDGLIRLRANSTLKFERLSKKVSSSEGKLVLSFGHLLCKFETLVSGAKIEISTPTAFAGVRGTELGVFADENSTEVGVLEGTVEVKSATVEAAPVIVGSHQKTVVNKGQSPGPAKELREEDLQKLLEIKTLHVGDALQTFEKTVRGGGTGAALEQIRSALEVYVVDNEGYPRELNLETLEPVAQLINTKDVLAQFKDGKLASYASRGSSYEIHAYSNTNPPKLYISTPHGTVEK